MKVLGGAAALVIGAAMVAACGGSDSKKRRPPDDGDAGDASSQAGGRAGTGGAGSGGAPAAGGSPSAGGAAAGGSPSAGGAAAGGSPGAGGVQDAGPEADAALEADVAVEAGLVCQAPVLDDAGNPVGSVDAGDGGDASNPNRGEWRDFAANRCAACPAQEIICEHLDGPQATFDFATRRLQFIVEAGVAEVVSATLELSWEATVDAGFASGSATAVVTVDGNTLTADLSSQIPDGVYYLNPNGLTLLDACGRTSFVGDRFDNTFISAHADDADSGTTVNIHCEQ